MGRALLYVGNFKIEDQKKFNLDMVLDATLNKQKGKSCCDFSVCNNIAMVTL